jgi:hypothetical protein
MRMVRERLRDGYANFKRFSIGVNLSALSFYNTRLKTR